MKQTNPQGTAISYKCERSNMARSCLQGDLSGDMIEKVSRPEILKGPAIVFKGLGRLPGLRQT